MADPKLHEGIFATDVGDAWNIHTPALARLLTLLFTHRDSVVVLSGDIHYGAGVRLSHHQGNSSSVLVQLTASALRNESLRTTLLHTHLKDWSFPERIRHSIGWNHPPQMLPFRSRRSRHDRHTPHDWECVLEWVHRNRATVASFSGETTEKEHRHHSVLDPTRWQSRSARESTSASLQLKHCLQRLRWWQSRWFQDGREVVGLNNLAVVQWQAQTIVQDLYWCAPWLPTQIVFSRFVASMLHERSCTNEPTAPDLQN